MTTSERPTRVRYIILALTVCVAVLLYLDRYCLGFVLPYIRDNYRLSEDDAQFLVSAFFYTYAFGQIPCGWLSDRFGTRVMLALYLAIWSTLTGLTGFAQGLLTLVLFRFGCGLFEAGAYPACAGLIRRWIPYQQRGLASGVVSIGGRLGGTIAPLATAYLMVLFMPLSTPSLFEPRDLLNPHKLAHDMLSENDKKLPESVQQALPHLQKKMSPQTRQVLNDFRATPSDGAQQMMSPTILADAINDLLKQPDLADDIDLAPIKPKLNKQAVALFAPSAAPRSDEEITRRNRCLLEVLFPDCIRKLEGDSWQPVLLIYGTIGVLLAIFFWGFYRDTPRQHFLTNEAEAELVEAYEKSAEAPTTPAFSAVALGMLTSPGLWASGIVQFGTNFVWIFLGNQLPTYLQRVHEVPIESRGWMTFWPFCVSLPMLLVGGWWTDSMTKKYGKRIGRAFPLASTRFIGAGAMAACYFLDAPWPIIIALCVFAMASDSGIPAIWAYNLDVGGRNVGLILGWGNMIGNLGAAVSAYLLGFVLRRFVDFDAVWTIDEAKAGYGAVFLTCAGVFVFIGIVSLFVDATKPIGGTEKPA
jgi:ACS family glucarate transporter-like MFS transporter